MSLATTYAAAIATAQNSLPTSFTGPGGLLNATVDEQGNCLLVIANSQKYSVPPAVMLAFANWVTTTFT
jgi:hypothetical protein